MENAGEMWMNSDDGDDDDADDGDVEWKENVCRANWSFLIVNLKKILTNNIHCCLSVIIYVSHSHPNWQCPLWLMHVNDNSKNSPWHNYKSLY